MALCVVLMSAYHDMRLYFQSLKYCFAPYESKWYQIIYKVNRQLVV
jgi:hypothetical protein